MLVGFTYWIRQNGVLVLIIISITYLLTFRKSQNFLRNYGIGIIFFIIIISPMLIQKNDQYGDPFYSVYQDILFSKNYEAFITKAISDVDTQTETSASEFIKNEGILSFINNFIFGGIAFWLDGVFIGALKNKLLRDTMIISGLIFFLFESMFGNLANLGLWMAFLSFFIARSLLLGSILIWQLKKNKFLIG